MDKGYLPHSTGENHESINLIGQRCILATRIGGGWDCPRPPTR